MEPLYTYDEWLKYYKWEQGKLRQVAKKKRQRRIIRALTSERTKQKLAGLFFILIGIVCPIIMPESIGASLFTIPLGVVVIASKENLLN